MKITQLKKGRPVGRNELRPLKRSPRLPDEVMCPIDPWELLQTASLTLSLSRSLSLSLSHTHIHTHTAVIHYLSLEGQDITADTAEETKGC